MKLPNGSKALVAIEKLRDYALDFVHEEGKHKARVFAAALDLTAADAEWLRTELLDAAVKFECVLGKNTPFGQRFVQDFSLTRGDRAARVRSVWNIPPGETVPRLITCHVL